MDVVVIQILAFTSMLMLVIGINNLVRGEKRAAADTSSKPALFKAFSNEIATVGQLIGPAIDRASPLQAVQIRKDLIAANLPMEINEIRGMQGLACVSLGMVAGIGVFLYNMNWSHALIAMVFFALLGWVYPVSWLGSTARRRKDAMSKALPYAIDLVTVSMQAGQDFGASVRHLVNEGPRGPLRDEFSVMLRQTELGKSRIEALKAMAERIQLDEFRSLVTSVIQSTEMGASIAATLKLQAEEIRRARYHKAERQAARAPSLMLIPVALFILPAVFIIIFTPIVIRFMESGMGGMGGQ